VILIPGTFANMEDDYGALAPILVNDGYCVFSLNYDGSPLSPTTHGTTLDGLTNLAQFFPGASQLVASACPACADQETGSAVITALDNGPIAQAGVSYTVIETLDEFVVTPVGSSFIHEPGVANEYVQSSCPFDPVDHADLSYDNTAIRLALNALDPATARSPNCFEGFPAPAVQQ
jgi:hypothetical protein